MVYVLCILFVGVVWYVKDHGDLAFIGSDNEDINVSL